MFKITHIVQTKKKLLNNLSNVLNFLKPASLEISVKTSVKLIGKAKNNPFWESVKPLDTMSHSAPCQVMMVNISELK